MKLSTALIVGLFISAFCVGCGNQVTAATGGTPPGGGSSLPSGVTVISASPGDTSTGYRDHPDPSICVGPAHVLEFNGLDVIIRAKSAIGTIVSSATQASFWSTVVTQTGGGHFTPTGPQMSDPSCYYDPLSQRWFVANNDGGGTLGVLIAISATSDPTGTWHGFQDASPSAGADVEPTLAADKNGFYMCGFDGTGSVPTTSSYCDAFPIADMEWTGAGYPVITHKNRIQGFQQQVRPVADTNASKGSSAYFIIAARSGASQNCASAPCAWGWMYTTVQWSGTTASVVGTQNATLSSSLQWYSPPSSGVSEPGGHLIKATESHACGIPYADATSTTFYIACSQGISSTHMGIFWAQINPTTPSVIQSGMLAPVDGSSNPIDALFASVSLDSSGNAAIAYTGVSSTIYPSTYVTARLASDTLGTFRTPYQIYPGTTAYTATSPAGWGVYGYSAIDPADGTLWTYNQIGLSATNWATGIVHFTVSAP